MDYSDPSRAPIKLKKAPPEHFPSKQGVNLRPFTHRPIKTKKGKVVYFRKKSFFSWVDANRIIRSLDFSTPAGLVIQGGYDEIKDYYAFIDLFLLLTSMMGDLHLELPVYLDGFLSADPRSGWKTSKLRALRDRVRHYLTDQYREVIISLAKDYFDLFKGIKDFKIEDVSLSSFVK